MNKSVDIYFLSIHSDCAQFKEGGCTYHPSYLVWPYRLNKRRSICFFTFTNFGKTESTKHFALQCLGA